MEHKSTRSSAGREVVLVAALALPAMLLRGAQILEQQAAPALSDLRGLGTDAVIATLAACIVCGGVRAARWIGVVLGFVWVLLGYANYEHIRALGALLNLDYAGYITDSTFFFGSALSPARPWLLVTALAISLIGVLHATADRAPTLRLVPLAGAGLLGVALLWAWPVDEDSAGWRQRHFAMANIAALFDTPIEAPLDRSPNQARSAGDLEGVPQLALPQPGHNVLLIIIEGISGAHVTRIREAQGASSPIAMPELDALADRGLAWSSFISLQRQTNRGEYALLCGDSPKLIAGTPKMTELTGIGDLPCLPARLGEQGYATVYLQGAPLPFMFKDQFMVQAGFERVHGDEWFDPSEDRNHWGNDDRTFFEGSMAMVRSLQDEQRPWLLTLMTVGTHHPFNVPEDFVGSHEPGSFAWAAEYLDDALGTFVRALEAEGVLEDTLVLITSDESSGLHRSSDDVTKALGQAWGLLIALTPEGDRGLMEETMLQSDLALSVLDYLGDASASQTFAGRSAFRSYATGRSFAFGNTYRRVLGGVSDGGDLFVCNQNAARCRKFAVPGGRLFSPERQPLEMSPEEAGFLKARALESLQSGAALPHSREYDLIAERDVQLLSTPNMQLVFSGQGLSASDSDRLEVVIDLELRPGPEGASAPASAWLAHDLISGEQKRRHYLRRLEGLRVGQRAEIRYHVIAPTDLENIEARLRVHRYEGPAPVLHFHEAKLRILTGEASKAVARGTVEDAFRIIAVP